MALEVRRGNNNKTQCNLMPKHSVLGLSYEVGEMACCHPHSQILLSQDGIITNS